MGNEQSMQRAGLRPAPARVARANHHAAAAPGVRPASRATQQQPSAQHRSPSPENRLMNRRSDSEPATGVMLPDQRVRSQRKTVSLTRSSNRRSTTQHKTPSPQNRSFSHRSKSRSKTPTPSNNSAVKQHAGPGDRENEQSSPLDISYNIRDTSPEYFADIFEDDTSEDGPDDPKDPCLKIRYGRRKLRRVLKDLQEMYKESRERLDVLETESERLQTDNNGLQIEYRQLLEEYQRYSTEIRDLRGELRDRQDASRSAGTRLQDQWNEIQDLRHETQDLRTEIQDLRQTNGNPQNENADLRLANRNLRIENDNLRAQIRDMEDIWEENERLRENNSWLGYALGDLREETGGGIEDWKKRYDELEFMTNEASDQSDRLRIRLQELSAELAETLQQLGQSNNEIGRLQNVNAGLTATIQRLGRANNDIDWLRDVDAELNETRQQLTHANNDINRLQATVDWLHHDDPSFAGSSAHASSDSRSTPRSSNASATRNTSSQGERGQTPDSSQSPSRRPRGGSNVPTAATTQRRMNTRSQVVDNARTPPPALFSPVRRTQQPNAAKPAGVSKATRKKQKGRR